MTKEEVIKHLEFMAKGYQNLLDNDERCLEAVGKGYKGEVEAQESLADVYKAQIDALNMAIKALEQQPCEDAISRKEVADIINRQRFGIHKISMGIIKEKLEALPPVTPIRPKGKWIEIIEEETAYSKTWHYECSECGKNNTCLGGNPNFCPHCGADMRSETE